MLSETPFQWDFMALKALLSRAYTILEILLPKGEYVLGGPNFLEFIWFWWSSGLGSVFPGSISYGSGDRLDIDVRRYCKGDLYTENVCLKFWIRRASAKFL